jgi:DNA-binding NarL/FixJ family response regulator
MHADIARGLVHVGTHRPISIILADDQAEVRKALRRALDIDGRFSIVAEAWDGSEALDRVALLKPDALVLDMAMPNMDGLEALPKIKDASPGTIVVVLSSMIPFGSVGDQALALGAAAVFDKYVSPKELIERIIAARLEMGDRDGTESGFQSDDLENLELPTPG